MKEKEQLAREKEHLTGNCEKYKNDLLKEAAFRWFYCIYYTYTKWKNKYRKKNTLAKCFYTLDPLPPTLPHLGC